LESLLPSFPSSLALLIGFDARLRENICRFERPINDSLMWESVSVEELEFEKTNERLVS